MAKLNIQDATGARAEVDVNLDLFRAASDAGAAHGLRHLDATIATKKTKIIRILRKPSDWARAVAHTVSINPDSTRTIHAMRPSPCLDRRAWGGYGGPLVRGEPQ